jgi:hypothetical protein
MFVFRFFLAALCFNFFIFSSEGSGVSAELIVFIKDPSEKSLSALPDFIDKNVINDKVLEASVKDGLFDLVKKQKDGKEISLQINYGKFLNFLDKSQNLHLKIYSDTDKKFEQIKKFNRVFNNVLSISEKIYKDVAFKPDIKKLKIEYDENFKQCCKLQQEKNFNKLRPCDNSSESSSNGNSGYFKEYISYWYERFPKIGAVLKFGGPDFYYVVRGFDKLDKFNKSLCSLNLNKIIHSYLDLKRLNIIYGRNNEKIYGFSSFTNRFALKSPGVDFLNEKIKFCEENFVESIKALAVENIFELSNGLFKNSKFELLRSIILCNDGDDKALFDVFSKTSDFNRGYEVSRHKFLYDLSMGANFDNMLSDVRFDLDGKIVVSRPSDDKSSEYFNFNVQPDGKSYVSSLSQKFFFASKQKGESGPQYQFGKKERAFLSARLNNLRLTGYQIKSKFFLNHNPIFCKESASEEKSMNLLFKHIQGSISNNYSEYFSKALFIDKGFDPIDKSISCLSLKDISIGIDKYKSFSDEQKLNKINSLKNLLVCYLKNEENDSLRADSLGSIDGLKNSISRLSNYSELIKDKVRNANEIAYLDSQIIYFNYFYASRFLENLAVTLKKLIKDTYDPSLQNSVQLNELNSKYKQVQTGGMPLAKDIPPQLVGAAMQSGINLLINKVGPIFDIIKNLF